jgi:hypothetical protein
MGTMMVIEQARLRECEATIEQGMATFVEVGQALAEIKAKKLYRDTHGTFELYCKGRWGHGRDWAYKLIGASEAAEKCIGTNTKPNASQAKVLAQAPKEKQAEVWGKASSNGKPTIAKVAAAVAEAEEDEWDVAVLEKPSNGPDITSLAAPYKQAGRDLDRIRREMQAVADNPTSGGHLLDKITRITTSCKELKATISQMEPTQLCEKCGGKGCRFCASTGFWTKAVVQSWRQTR